MLMVGGYSGYEDVHQMFVQRANFPAFNLPIVCLPCSFNNNLPGSELLLGHLQQGGDPSPFDRNLATRLVTHCIDRLIGQCSAAQADASFIGVAEGRVQFTGFEPFSRLVDAVHQRPKEQWWLGLREGVEPLAKAEKPNSG